jgi:hypothetical protein
VGADLRFILVAAPVLVPDIDDEVHRMDGKWWLVTFALTYSGTQSGEVVPPAIVVRHIIKDEKGEFLI